MSQKNFNANRGSNIDYTGRSVIDSADEWLRAAGLPTYSDLQERLKARATGTERPEQPSIVPEPPEFEDLAPRRSIDQQQPLSKMATPCAGQSQLSELQKLILKRGVTGFFRKGSVRWVCEQGEVNREFQRLCHRGLMRSTRVSRALAVGFATDEGHRALDQDADQF